MRDIMPMSNELRAFALYRFQPRLSIAYVYEKRYWATPR